MPQILVIDDDPGLLSVCTVGLQALGHNVRTAETGEEGINQSAVHTDFMIGGPDVGVTGRTRDGRELPVLVGGRWALG